MNECSDCGYLSADPIYVCPRCEADAGAAGYPPTAAIADDRPAPHYPCPECMGTSWRVVATFERGRWVDDDTYMDHDPPQLRVSSVGMDGAICDGCGHVMDLSEALQERGNG